MAHVRTQLRQALATLLTGLATTGDRVYQSRVHPLGKNEIPGLRIFVDGEDIAVTTIHNPAVLQRDLTVRVECVSALQNGLDDDLDQMALEVEHAVAADSDLGGLINGMLLPSGIEVDRSGDGEMPVGVLTISFIAQYDVENDAADTAL